VVSAPAPPLPMIAMEMLGEAAMAVFPLIGARFRARPAPICI
jgi:hypothetical protein